MISFTFFPKNYFLVNYWLKEYWPILFKPLVGGFWYADSQIGRKIQKDDGELIEILATIVQSGILD